MNSSKKDKHAASPAKYAIIAVIAVIAAIAGFATVYFSLAPSDNGSGSRSATKMTGEAASGSEADAKASPLKGLNKGAMAAFLVRSKPLDLPDFSLVDGDGATISLADLGGKVVLLNIWATWCVPCREEMPQLNDLQAALGGTDFEVVAVNIDKGGPDKARKFLDETKATDLTLYTDPTGKLFSKLRAVGMPTTLLINREGKEIGRLVGPADWASPQAKRLIETAIAASAPAG
ncbi:MAG: TlpA disulfide reductase family protein [Methyloceanibacter sp.]